MSVTKWKRKDNRIKLKYWTWDQRHSDRNRYCPSSTFFSQDVEEKKAAKMNVPKNGKCEKEEMMTIKIEFAVKYCGQSRRKRRTLTICTRHKLPGIETDMPICGLYQKYKANTIINCMSNGSRVIVLCRMYRSTPITRKFVAFKSHYNWINSSCFVYRLCRPVPLAIDNEIR